MKYICVETTFHGRLFEPGDEYEAVGEEEKKLKDNKCWKPVGRTSRKSDSSGEGTKSTVKSSE